jgi:hypothetical protein
MAGGDPDYFLAQSASIKSHAFFYSALDTSALFGLRNQGGVLVRHLYLVIARQAVFDMIQGHGVISPLLIERYAYLGTQLLEVFAHFHRLVPRSGPLVPLLFASKNTRGLPDGGGTVPAVNDFPPGSADGAASAARAGAAGRFWPNPAS